MNDRNQDNGVHPPRRVLALLDASRSAREVLDAAVELAAGMKGEVLGLYVEDIELLHGAGYPFSREISITSGAIRPLETSVLEARLREQARELRAALEQAATRRAVRASLEVRRGRLQEEVRGAARPEDLLVLGRVGWSAGRGRTLGSLARALLDTPPCAVMFAAGVASHVHEEQPGKAVMAVLDDPARDRRVLDIAAGLANHEGLTLQLVVPAAHAGEARTLAQGLTGDRLPVQVLREERPQRIIQHCHEQPARYLVAPRGSPLVGMLRSETLLAGLRPRLLLVP